MGDTQEKKKDIRKFQLNQFKLPKMQTIYNLNKLKYTISSTKKNHINSKKYVRRIKTSNPLLKMHFIDNKKKSTETRFNSFSYSVYLFVSFGHVH